MDLSAIIVVIVGTLLFFGFGVWMAIYSRRNNAGSETKSVRNEAVDDESALARNGI